MTTHTCTFLEQIKWKTFEYGPYNPKLAPTVCHFSHLKKFLAIQSLRSNQETKDSTGLAESLNGGHFHQGHTKGVPQCHNLHVNYVKKYKIIFPTNAVFIKT
jgi:hypothetical protein